jgi:hypothetical protein
MESYSMCLTRARASREDVSFNSIMKNMLIDPGSSAGRLGAADCILPIRIRPKVCADRWWLRRLGSRITKSDREFIVYMRKTGMQTGHECKSIRSGGL